MTPPTKRWIVEQFATNPMVARGPIGKAWRFVSHDVWRADVGSAGLLQRAFYRLCRVTFLTLRSFYGDRCAVRASALTYTTVLSLVPLLALSFAILKGLGFYDELREQRIDPYLNGLFGTLGDEGAQSAGGGMTHLRSGFDQVLNLVERTNVRGLGMIGLLILMLAALRLLASVESSFNEIWGVHKARSWVRKLSDYLTLVVVAPIFLFTAVGVTGAAQNTGVLRYVEQDLGLGFIVQSLVKVAPVLIGWVLFTLVYLVMPNRRTKFSSAAIGGLIAALAWQLALVLHFRFQIGVAKYNAIYAGFAALPIFLVWVQLSWLIVLFGAELAFAHESEREYHGFAGYEGHHHAFRERVALRAMTWICDSFLHGGEPRTALSVAAALGLSPREVEEVLADLVRGGLVAGIEVGDGADGQAYVPARDPGRITVVDVLDVLSGAGLDGEVAAHSELDRHVDRLMQRLTEEARTSAFNRTLRELVDEARRRALAESGSAATETSTQPL